MISPDEFRKSVQGPIVPLTTPIKEDDSIDVEGLGKLTEFYLDGGITCLIAAGSTGYCYTLTEAEHRQVVEAVVAASKKRAFVIAGVSHSGTRISNRLADLCEKAGADALLMTPPYYHQTGPGREGMYRHYAEVAGNHSLPLIIYNTRTALLDVDFFRRCAEVASIMGVKEAAADYNLARDLCIELGKRFSIIGGGSMRYYLWLWLWGSPGYVTSIANLVPQIEVRFWRHLQEGEIDKAKQVVIDMEQPFFEVMTEYGWHECLHAALKIFGLPAHKVRGPLVEPPEEHVAKLKAVFRSIGLME